MSFSALKRRSSSLRRWFRAERAFFVNSRGELHYFHASDRPLATTGRPPESPMRAMQLELIDPAAGGKRGELVVSGAARLPGSAGGAPADESPAPAAACEGCSVRFSLLRPRLRCCVCRRGLCQGCCGWRLGRERSCEACATAATSNAAASADDAASGDGVAGTTAAPDGTAAAAQVSWRLRLPAPTAELLARTQERFARARSLVRDAGAWPSAGLSSECVDAVLASCDAFDAALEETLRDVLPTWQRWSAASAAQVEQQGAEAAALLAVAPAHAALHSLLLDARPAEERLHEGAARFAGAAAGALATSYAGVGTLVEELRRGPLGRLRNACAAEASLEATARAAVDCEVAAWRTSQAGIENVTALASELPGVWARCEAALEGIPGLPEPSARRVLECALAAVRAEVGHRTASWSLARLAHAAAAGAVAEAVALRADRAPPEARRDALEATLRRWKSAEEGGGDDAARQWLQLHPLQQLPDGIAAGTESVFAAEVAAPVAETVRVLVADASRNAALQSRLDAVLRDFRARSAPDAWFDATESGAAVLGRLGALVRDLPSLEAGILRDIGTVLAANAAAGGEDHGRSATHYARVWEANVTRDAAVGARIAVSCALVRARADAALAAALAAFRSQHIARVTSNDSPPSERRVALAAVAGPVVATACEDLCARIRDFMGKDAELGDAPATAAAFAGALTAALQREVAVAGSIVDEQEHANAAYIAAAEDLERAFDERVGIARLRAGGDATACPITAARASLQSIAASGAVAALCEAVGRAAAAAPAYLRSILVAAAQRHGDSVIAEAETLVSRREGCDRAESEWRAALESTVSATLLRVRELFSSPGAARTAPAAARALVAGTGVRLEISLPLAVPGLSLLVAQAMRADLARALNGLAAEAAHLAGAAWRAELEAAYAVSDAQRAAEAAWRVELAGAAAIADAQRARIVACAPDAAKIAAATEQTIAEARTAMRAIRAQAPPALASVAEQEEARLVDDCGKAAVGAWGTACATVAAEALAAIADLFGGVGGGGAGSPRAGDLRSPAAAEAHARADLARRVASLDAALPRAALSPDRVLECQAAMQAAVALVLAELARRVPVPGPARPTGRLWAATARGSAADVKHILGGAPGGFSTQEADEVCVCVL